MRISEVPASFVRAVRKELSECGAEPFVEDREMPLVATFCETGRQTKLPLLLQAQACAGRLIEDRREREYLTASPRRLDRLEA